MKQFFKNAIIYKLLDESAQLTGETLEAALEQHQHVLPGSLDVSRYGFIPPFNSYLVEENMGVIVLAGKHSWRDLPPSVVNEQVEEKVKSLSEAEARTVGRKERQNLKDEIIFSLLPKAFIKHRVTYAMIINDLLIVDAGSRKEAEEFCSALREALGSLRALPLTTKNVPSQVMTHWIDNGTSTSRLLLGESCSLAGGKDGRILRCKNQDLAADEFVNHVRSGMYVEKISVELEDQATFDIDDTLAIKRISFSDLMQEKVADDAGEAESKREYCIAGMLMMAAFFKDLVDDLSKEFGGEEAA